ncbi:MAG: NAD-glutamate dehydrogenase domain-containing protein [Methylocystis sp.]|uniref:NAD-glutamate dehydrogenase domain-containing protein n=1 Tax=Methylocystis sp. TaxID=1911079 RepID=UPI003DA41526
MNGDTELRDVVERAVPLAARADAGTFQFPPNYAELTPPRQRGRDLLLLDRLQSQGGVAVDLRQRAQQDGAAAFEIRIYGESPHDLDALTPMLHNLGLPAVDQTLFTLTAGGTPHFIRSFLVRPAQGGRAAASKPQLLRALAALLAGEATDDPLNQLILLAGLDWREVDALRGYCHYYVQLGGRVGRTRLYEALLRKAEATRLLFSYFETRFAPAHAGQGALDALADIRQRLIVAFDKVENATDDSLLRDLFNLIDATLRTNFYAPGARSALAFKFDSLGVMSAPAPKPFVEIFVHAPSFEGVHLRGAPVSRGGLRWSDRAHDLRAEILDLMQTQMVKNALIVPQGAKGGFVLKAPLSDPIAREGQGKAAYRAFVGALLDLTDNLGAAHAPERPRDMRVYDDPDPYLVVAADKGTAAWSDIANEIATARGFWLGDAFATGGSNGYHHKKLGITARGAWVCARRHFLELGRDLDHDPVTVVGVGSMDGDVFGNGMLLSDKLKLLGAFSGSHIFIDPDPDPAVSFAERRRLFDLPRSSWANYDPAKLSPGGGVWRRDAKDIELSQQARDMLGARHRLVDGEGLIRLLLTAPVDLIWMGGVGTYVKGADESDESVGDRANDGARVNAGQLRARVVAEGANLAFTKRARVEYALNGGRIDTDAVDNSAGVDLSDHEVNLKILFKNDPQPARLQALTEEVCAAVLDDNYHQSLSLSLEQLRARDDVPAFMDVADRFEAAGRLDRANDGFPTRKDVLARAEKGLTRPELALLMADAKLALKRALLEAPHVLDANWARAFLSEYFPQSLRFTHAAEIVAHPLAREIAATVICNRIVDQAGARFLLFGDPLTPDLLIRAVELYLAFDAILEGARWRQALRDLTRDPQEKYRARDELENTLSMLCRAALQRGLPLRPEKQQIAAWRADLQAYLAYLLPGATPSILDAVSTAPSRRMFLARLRDFPFLVDLARASGNDVAVIARLFDDAAALLGLPAIAAGAAALSARDGWEARLQRTLETRLRCAAARIAGLMLRGGASAPADVFEQAGLTPQLLLLQKLHDELITDTPKTISPYALFAAELDALVDGCDAPRRA